MSGDDWLSEILKSSAPYDEVKARSAIMKIVAETEKFRD